MPVGLWLVALLADGSAPSLVQDFGSAAVNGSGNQISLSFSLKNVVATPKILIGGIDFSTGSLTCNNSLSTCSAAVTFAPRSAGLKQDALVLTDGKGNVLASASLHGMGVAPSLRVLPATISTYAGSGSWGYFDGQATFATFRNPQGLTMDLAGNVFVADSLNQVIRKVSPSGLVSTIAGTGSAGYSGDGGLATNATLNTPTGITMDAAGDLFIADQGNSLIRRVDAVSGLITTVAGGGNSTANGVTATSAELSGPNAVAVDTAGNLFIADTFHNLVREVAASTGLMTTVAGGGTQSLPDFGNGGKATSAQLDNPAGIALDSTGAVYISDTGHSMVRRVDPASGIITQVAGTGVYGSSGDGGPARSALLASPQGLRLDANNNLYIADMGADLVRFVNSATGQISTIVGNGTQGRSGDGGVAASAALSSPSDVTLDAAGNVFIADYSNNVIRKVAFNPPTLIFPATNLALTSAAIPVTVENWGNATLNLSGLSISNGFEQLASGSNPCSASSALAPGINCTSALAFAPTTPGTLTGTLTVNSNSNNQNSSMVVSLSGQAMSGTPAASLSATSLSFPNQPVNSLSSGQTLTVQNTGTAALAIATIQVSGADAADFVVSASTCQSVLAENASCTVTIKFEPPQSGTRTGMFTLTNSGANPILSATLTGVGTGGATPQISTSAMQFGSQLVTSAGAAQSLTLTNSGVAPLYVYSATLSGPNSSDFWIDSSTCGSSIAASSSCSFSISFVPTAAGIRTASLLLTLSAGITPQAISLNGAGMAQACVSSITPASQLYAAAGASDSVTVTAANNCQWSSISNVDWIVINSGAGTGSGTVQFSVSPNTTAQPRSGTITLANQTETITQMGIGLRFVPVTPCRIADTRNPNGPFGGPLIAGGTAREFLPQNSACGIPSTAQAYALNITVVPAGPLGYLTVWPSGQTRPLVSTLNSHDGRVRANAAVVPAGNEGGISAYASNSTDLVLDISGYFVAATDISALSFYPVSPCRIVDTRVPNGVFGSPRLAGGTVRNFPLQASNCGLPASAQAYSLNFTVVPKGIGLGYLTTWPAGQSQPLVSTLNNAKATVVANAALVPAGTSGDISVYVTNDTDVVIDVDGYFAPQATGGLSLYNLAPCRSLDTRAAGGAPFSGTLNVSTGPCAVPPNVQGLVLNATAVPAAALGFISLWPTGGTQPTVSTLNASDGLVTANMAVVPVTNDKFSAYASNPTHLVVDLLGYFGP